MNKFSNIKPVVKKVVKPILEKLDPLLEDVELNDTEKFFSKLFESREVAHVFHLQTNGEEGSYAKHMALNSYYEDILGQIDDLIEIYTGQYGIVENYNVIDVNSKGDDVIKYFEDLATYITEDKYKAIKQEDTHLHSIVDNILCIVYKTLFKLKYNK